MAVTETIVQLRAAGPFRDRCWNMLHVLGRRVAEGDRAEERQNRDYRRSKKSAFHAGILMPGPSCEEGKMPRRNEPPGHRVTY